MNTKYQKTLFVQFWRISSTFMILSMLVSSIGVNPVAAQGTLVVVSATPSGTNALISSIIEIEFDQPILPATFAGSINGQPMVPTQIVVKPGETQVSVDPGEMEYGKTYAVMVAGTVTGADSAVLGSNYSFNFTVMANPNSKAPTTNVVISAGQVEAGNTVTISGSASGYIWQRDANNPLELRHWSVDGTDTGDSPMLHPTALYFPNGMDGYKFWLFYTPYPSAADENPVLMRSNDGVNFTAEGVPHNPLFAYNFQPPFDMQNLADPEAYYVGKTWMLFYEMETPSLGDWMGSGGNIGVALSTDGKTWEPYGGAYTYDPLNPPTDFPVNGNPVVKPPEPASSGYRSGEMAVVFKDGIYHMWRTAINGGLYIYHDTAADPRGPWTLQSDKLDMGGYEYGPHPDVVYDAERNLYLMLYLIPSGTNVGQLGLYTSSTPSGPWTLHPINPIFSAQSSWEGSSLYRSSMVKVDGQWYMYYSGNTTGNPQIGLAREVAGVRRVEVSTNGGTTWQPAAVNQNGSWTYSWTPSQPGAYTVQARVIDDFMQGSPTTGISVPVSSGPLPAVQAPVLVIKDSSLVSNPYNGYITEILKAEGLTEFQQVELGALMGDADPLAFLNQFSVVLLTQSTINSSARQVLQDYVTDGGNLIAMRPDPALADLFGLTYMNTRAEQNLQFFAIEAASEAGSGIVHGSLQYHGAADNYTVNGASALAYLWNNISTPSTNPAVTLNNVGAGSAIAFTFDLAKSIVMTRQGNPAWKDSEGDGLGGYRPMDMFVRSNGDWWLSGDRMRIPQADEEQRFLANLILTFSEKPLPRMWYLPGDQHTILVSTGDAEGVGGTALEPVMNDIAAYGGHYTSYLMEGGVSSTTPEVEAGWRAAGHEVGPHVYGGGPDTCEALAPAYAQIASNILSKFGHVARTARSHTIDWCGWSDMAEIESNNGTEMDTNYYHYNNLLLQYGDNANGYFTGTGLPQRFMNEQGSVLPIYQATTQFPDEWFADNGKIAAQITTIIQDLIVASENGNYSAFVANIHHVRYDNTPSDPTHIWANQIWAYAQSHDVPLWSAEMLLDFVKARDGSRFNNLTFSNGVLTFDFVPGAARQDLTVMIPASHLGNNLLSVSLDGANQTIITETVKGLEYARFTAPSAGGHVTATYGQDTTSPVISGVQANAISDVAATINWQTDEAASSKVEYGTNPANLNLSATVPGNVTSHVIPLSGLNPLTQYHYRVVSVDRAGNPASVSPVYTFTTGMPRWVETTTADFSDGVLNDTEVTTVVDGEVILGVGSGVRDDFSGNTLNTTTWFATNLFGGDPVVSVSDGQATVSSGTYIRTNQTYFQKSLEGMVTLRSGPNAHFGWANTVNAGDDGIADPNWIIFTSSNGTLSARTRLNDGQGTLEEINTPLAGIALDVPHLFKIVWNTDNSVQFWVDGVLKTTHTRNFTEPFRVYITSNAGQSTSADWVRVLGDYTTTGGYESSAFDSGQVTDFDSLTWTGESAAGTTVNFETRTSNDGLAWNEWLPAVSGGAIDNPSGQFIQYRATLSTNNTTVTPRIDEVTITYQPAGADTNPPVVNSVTPADQASGVSIDTNITINFNEPIDTATFAATINGATAFTAAYQNGNRVAVLNPDVNFDPDSLVNVSVSGSVSDRAGNALGSAYEWHFITSAQSTGWVETTTTDFSDGVADKILISNAGDGELRLIPNFDDHFTGSALGSDWVSGMWGSGAYSPTVSDSVMTHATPNSYVHSTKSFAAGTSVEGRVKFEKGGNTTAGYLYFGLAGTGLVPWALFGTGYTGDQVYASTYNARSGDPVQVGLGNLFGIWHDYKITYKTDRVEYYVDGILRHTEMVSIPGPLNIYFSDGPSAPVGASVASDWIRVNQYSSIQETVTEFSDDFSGVVLNWDSLGNPQFGGPSGADFHLDGGKLVHGAMGTSYHPAVPANVGAFRNFEFEVDADSPNVFWAIAWGLQDNAHYYFAQSYGGTLRVYRLDNWFNSYTQLGNGFSAPAIVGGVPQHIRLIGQNSTYTIYVNDTLVSTVTDATYPIGKVGVVGYETWVTNFDNAVLRGFGATVIPGGSGAYTSDAHDFGSVQIWNGLSWTGQNPTDTSVQFATRSSLDNVTWSDWADVDGSGNIASPSNRYLQYRAQLVSTDLNMSPVVEEVVINSSMQPTLYALTVTTNGNGTVISDPTGIDCGISCSYDFNKNAFVTLTATPSIGSTFTGWSGAGCSGTGTCVVAMTVARSVTANFTLDNRAPVAVGDTYNTDAGVALTIAAPGVLTNDTDVDLDPLTAIKVSDPANGILVLNANGSFTYTPTSGYTGDDTFTYKANDGAADSNIATVTIHVEAVIPPPPLPSSFYGEIHIFDNPPQIGHLVQVFLPNASSPIATATIQLADLNLIYLVKVPGDVAGTPATEGALEGETLTFKIGDRVVATGAWHSGTSVELNLHPPKALPGGLYEGNAGTEISFGGSANDWGGSVGSTYEWDWENDGTYDETAQNTSHTWTNSGNYTVGLKVTDSQGGIGTATVDVAVTKIPITVVLNDLDQTYNGLPRPVTVTTFPADLDIETTYDEETTVPTDVGSYDVVATITEPNYTGSAAGTLNIGQASSTVTVTCPTTPQTYTGSAITACTASYSGVGGLTGTLPVTYEHNVDVGEATASASYAGDANHTGNSNSATFNIGQASSTVTVTCPTTPQTYTGSAITACTASYSTEDGLTGPLTPTYTNNTNVGEATASANYAGDANHTGNIGLGGFSITPASAPLTLENLNQSYDGTPKSVTVITIPTGLPVHVTYEGLPTPPTALGSYEVVATVTDPNYTGSANGTLIIAQATATHNIALEPGWNLVSFNVQPTSTAITSVLASLNGNYDLVYAWDAMSASNNWMKYSPTAPGYSNSLNNLDETMGFWIHMTAADTLDVTGDVPVTTNINLSAAGGGWNLVAYPSGADRPLPEALSSNGVSTDFSLMYAYHANDISDTWKLFSRTTPPWANDLTELEPGWGYWIKVSADHAWSVKYLADQ